MRHSSVYARSLRKKPKSDKLLTVVQVAEILNCSKSNIYKLVDNEELAKIKIGVSKGFRIKESNVFAYLEKINSDEENVDDKEG